MLFGRGNPCNYAVLDVIILGLNRFLPKVSSNHLVVVAVDRYIAVQYPLTYDVSITYTAIGVRGRPVYPLTYEDKITDTVVNRMIGAKPWIIK